MNHQSTTNNSFDLPDINQNLTNPMPNGQQVPSLIGKIQLKIMNQMGEILSIKMGNRTKFKKLMKLYCQTHNLNESSVKLLYDSDRVYGEQTPDDFKMKTGDQIFVVEEQIGG